MASVLQKNFGEYSSYNGWTNFRWVSFYNFFEKINVLDDFKFKQYKKLIQSNCFNAYEYENFVFAIQPPIRIERNSLGQLHSLENSAVEFKDGTSYNFINGRSIPMKYFESISSETFKIEEFINESNEEHKSTCIAFMQEKFGDEYLVNFFRQYLSEIDTFVDKKEEKYLDGTTKGMNIGVYTLFKGKINNENIAYVRCYCPSTDRMFFLGVDEKHNNAKDAIASLCRLPKKMIPYLKELKRQGERISSFYEENGWKLYKTLTKDDIEDLVPIDGNTYFHKMTYEY